MVLAAINFVQKGMLYLPENFDVGWFVLIPYLFNLRIFQKFYPFNLNHFFNFKILLLTYFTRR